jgi:hypothetical protein
MAKTTRPRRRLSRVAVTGLKEIPANAAWVLAKALRPATEGASAVAEHVSDAASSAAGSTRSASEATRRRAADAGRSVADAVPGLRHDSVSALMKDADAAAERARQREAEAVALAQRAKDESEEAARIAADAQRDVEATRRDASARVTTRVEAARRESQAAVEEVEREQAERDAADDTLGRSVLTPADGAVEVDTTGLTLEQVVARVVALT